MKLHIDCDISLSKKLRAILGESGSVTLQTESIVNGKGKGRLILVSNNEVHYSDLPDELKKETSIMLTPFQLSDASGPTDADPQFGSIFATSVQTPQAQPQQAQPESVTDLSGAPQQAQPQPQERTPVDRLAVTTPPNDNEISGAVVRSDEIKTPQGFPELNEKPYIDYVRDFDELMKEVNLAKSKVVDIDPAQISDPRLRAVEQEKKERLESIEKKAYIVTDKSAISINDMDISLSANMPYDLSNISAKRIALSNDLRELMNLGYIKVITPEEVPSYVQKSTQTRKTPQLEVFDDHEEAERNMERMEGVGGVGETSSDSYVGDAQEIDMDSYEESKTEDEIMLNDLTRGMR